MRIDLDGNDAYAYTGGKRFDPALPGVVFVHGALHDHSVWILQSRYLAHHGHAVLAIDLPAHGRSSGSPLGVAAGGRWLASIVEASGLRSAALVGHSMGSLIALEAAACLGARASALVMLGPAYPMKVSPKLLELCQRDVLSAIDLVNSLSHSSHAAKPSNPGPGSSIRGGNRALSRRMQRGYAAGNLFLADFTACDGYDEAKRVMSPFVEDESRVDWTPGGASRQESMIEGLSRIEPFEGLVAVHDAARPAVPPSLVASVVEAASVDGGAIAALPVVETIKEASSDLHVTRTVPRERLYRAQTPQCFRDDLLRQAVAKAVRDGFTGTDEASLVERLGARIRIVLGSEENLKVTTLEDLGRVEYYLKEGT